MSDIQHDVCLDAFGVRVSLEAGDDAFLREDSLWRVREIYERFLAVELLPKNGIAVDIGAGFGAFALPFALSNPQWSILCFEPNPASFDLLKRNIAAHGAENIVPVQCAVAGGGGSGRAVVEALGAMNSTAIRDRASEVEFLENVPRPAFLSSAAKKNWRDSSQLVRYPAVAPDAVAQSGPTLVKFTCPGHEDELLKAIGPVAPFILGESWIPPRASHVYREDASEPRVYAPLAGTNLRLQRGPDIQGRHPGLDVVIPMYNAREWIIECLDDVLNNAQKDIRAIIVDDGSTDGSADLVRDHYAENPRLRILKKRNGGCASARNFGRLNSDATHIAFVDADDYADSAFFPTVLELARYSGAPVTQGAYDLAVEQNGHWSVEPSTEPVDIADPIRRPFRDLEYYRLKGHKLIPTQPTIWRRIYRRDFLDARNVWFPEHIRAFDDQIFHILTLQYADEIICTDAVKYHYRQHPGQDIRQVDERGFASLDMYRAALKRAVAEGWRDYTPVVRSFRNTIGWTVSTIRPDLQAQFVKGAAELWVVIEKVFGEAIRRIDPLSVEAPGFATEVADCHKRYAGLDQAYFCSYLSSSSMYPELVRLHRVRNRIGS